MMTLLDQYSQAFAVWEQNHPNDDSSVRYVSFASFISGPNSVREHRISLLLGPHAKTVIKAYYARMED